MKKKFSNTDNATFEQKVENTYLAQTSTVQQNFYPHQFKLMLVSFLAGLAPLNCLIYHL